MSENKDIIVQRFQETIEVKEKIIRDVDLVNSITSVAESMTETLRNGGKILICGNGGSASDSLHFSAELIGRFQKDREALPSIALNSDVAALTAIANDFGYETVFARQVRGLLNPGDMFVGISTSGNSENVILAVKTASEMGGKTCALLGRDGGKLRELVDYPIIVPSAVTARIQESHICIIHVICELIEQALA